jgi:mercuric reductase
MHDLAVIGSGAAAFAAAIAARTRGHDVIMIEHGIVGGTCVNSGCVPSKALLAAATRRHEALATRFTGIATSAQPTDLAALATATHNLTAGLRADKYTTLAADHGWDIVRGHARFTGTESGPAIVVDLADGATRQLEAAHYLVATGATPWAPPIDGLAAAGYLTSTTALALDTLPASMVVLGGSAIGLEQVQLWSRLGVRTTLVEARERLAPVEEPEVSQAIATVLADEAIAVHTATTVTAVCRDTTGYTLTATDHGRPVVLHAEQVLVATGRQPATGGMHLSNVDVAVGARREVLVDDHLRSTNPRIWAAGDVTGGPQFVYVAAAQGTLVADNAMAPAGAPGRTLDYRTLPRVTFTRPGLATVGMTDAEAVAAGVDCECRVLPLHHVPRALVDRDTRGLIKLVADRGTGELLGVHVVAHGAEEVIAAATTALANRMTVHQLATQWCPYLTMAEGLKLAAQTFTRDVAKLSCCAA